MCKLVNLMYEMVGGYARSRRPPDGAFRRHFSDPGNPRSGRFPPLRTSDFSRPCAPHGL